MISQTLINFIQMTVYSGDGAVWDVFDKFWTALFGNDVQVEAQKRLGWVLILAGIAGAAVSAVRFVTVLNRKEEDKGGIKYAWKYLLFAIISICVGFAGVAILMHIGQGAQDYNV